MPSQRLDDRIRELCSKVVDTRDGELEPLLTKLKTALREHTVQMRKLAAESLIGKTPTMNRRDRSSA